MRKIENKVRKAVENGEVVQYNVQPVYKGSNLVPRAVQIDAYGSSGFSIEVSIINPIGE
jgi:hypothetical protein